MNLTLTGRKECDSDLQQQGQCGAPARSLPGQSRSQRTHHGILRKNRNCRAHGPRMNSPPKGKVSFRALGAGQSPRGSRNEAIRPDVLLVDDFDTDEDTKNPDIIQKRWDWWENALYPTRSISEPTLVIFCGNIIAKDCCVVRAGEMADSWDIVNIRDKNGFSTWPERTRKRTSTAHCPKYPKRRHRENISTTRFPWARYSRTLHTARFGTLKFKFLVVYGDPAPGEARVRRQILQDGFALWQIGWQALRHQDFPGTGAQCGVH